MKAWLHTLAMVLVLVAFAGCSQDNAPTAPDGSDAPDALASRNFGNHNGHHGNGGEAVVANRGSGTISVIDARTLDVETYDLPAGDNPPEPMYVVQVGQRVFVGDRANSRVVAFSKGDYDVVGTVPAGQGVFHMWADGLGRQLWVSNDVDNTMTVIDPHSLTVLATVPLPADLVAMGGKPHDVVLPFWGLSAYVTMLGFAEGGYVVKFDTHTFEETARAAVGGDPHLSVARQRPWLYVPCQDTNEVRVLNRFTLEQETALDIPGAHGAGMRNDGQYFYTTNISGGGDDAIWTIRTRTNTLVGSPVDSPYGVPHNLALSTNGKQFFLTHSGGASDKVTVYRTHGSNPVPDYVGEVTVGLNPFGLAFVK
ncbi:MAG: YncE family protein [Candidatus Latescibacteria bacterium]|nr:YncE family protein [Candidatus Latescibacterota bacterium]